MIQYLPRFFCMLMCVLLSSCGIILPQSDYIWSENYALEKMADAVLSMK
ncbi:MAG: hypothetical protein OXP71_05745 [Candidatus Poribacteria bacterium]|nr:hypothetical protein [Candidatus Poribacteria bacterium]